MCRVLFHLVCQKPHSKHLATGNGCSGSAQLIISFAVTGTSTLSSSGGTVLSNWYFPAVYLEKEYGQFLGRKSPEAEEGQKRFPQVSDKIRYLASNYKEALYTYARLLIGSNLMTGSNFINPDGGMNGSNRAVLYLQKWAIYLNRAFVGLHAAMFALLLGMIVFGTAVVRHKPMLVFYTLQTFADCSGGHLKHYLRGTASC